jgi:cytochrome c
MLKPILTFAAVAAIATSATLSAEAKAPPEALQTCAGCHDITQARTKLVGPPLYGIYGKKPQMGGVKFAKWDKKTLDAFLADPQKVKPGSTMPINVPDAKERAAMIKAIEGLK